MNKKAPESTKNLKESTFFVEGMHCPACELIIERKLLENEEVESVEASTKEGKVDLYHRGADFSLKKLNKRFKKLGYTFSLSPKADQKDGFLFSLDN